MKSLTYPIANFRSESIIRTDGNFGKEHTNLHTLSILGKREHSIIRQSSLSCIIIRVNKGIGSTTRGGKRRSYINFDSQPIECKGTQKSSVLSFLSTCSLTFFFGKEFCGNIIKLELIPNDIIGRVGNHEDWHNPNDEKNSFPPKVPNLNASGICDSPRLRNVSSRHFKKKCSLSNRLMCSDYRSLGSNEYTQKGISSVLCVLSCVLPHWKKQCHDTFVFRVFGIWPSLHVLLFGAEGLTVIMCMISLSRESKS